MMRYLVVALGLLASQAIAAQGLLLENTQTGRTKALRIGGEIEFYLTPPTSKLTECSSRLLKGHLSSPKRNLIRVLPKYDRKRYTYSNGLRKEDEVYYDNLGPEGEMNVKPAEVEVVIFRNEKVEDLHNMSLLLTTLGAFSALVVAPLVSIDYGNGDFNGDRYMRVAGYSLAATGVGVAVAIGTSKRHYTIARPGETASKKRWTIKLP